jgi:hypothetical protein
MGAAGAPSAASAAVAAVKSVPLASGLAAGEQSGIGIARGLGNLFSPSDDIAELWRGPTFPNRAIYPGSTVYWSGPKLPAWQDLPHLPPGWVTRNLLTGGVPWVGPGEPQWSKEISKMSEEILTPPIDKSTWGPGPWQTEPDRVDFIRAGFACFALRHDHYGHWCGYVGVPSSHPLYGVQWRDFDVDLKAHQGVNYSAPCSGAICHVPAPGMPADVWWIGFDCGHSFDLSPAMAARERELDKLHPTLAAWYARREDLHRAHRAIFPREVYRMLPYVRREIERLADQLAKVATRHEIDGDGEACDGEHVQ